MIQNKFTQLGTNYILELLDTLDAKVRITLFNNPSDLSQKIVSIETRVDEFDQMIRDFYLDDSKLDYFISLMIQDHTTAFFIYNNLG
jgi:hypothetical protein